VPKQLRIRSYRMNLPPLRTLFFEDLSIGMTETLEKTVSSSDVVGFAQLTRRSQSHPSFRTFRGPHLIRQAHRARTLYRKPDFRSAGHTRLPGPGAIYISQTLNFRAPVKIGDTVLVTVTVQELIAEKSRARLSCICSVDDEVVLDGEALVKVPSEKTAKGKRPIPKL
jgi:3-hydroxybutyryl-CoA dehydratase